MAGKVARWECQCLFELIWKGRGRGGKYGDEKERGKRGEAKGENN